MEKWRIFKLLSWNSKPVYNSAIDYGDMNIVVGL